MSSLWSTSSRRHRFINQFKILKITLTKTKNSILNFNLRVSFDDKPNKFKLPQVTLSSACTRDLASVEYTCCTCCAQIREDLDASRAKSKRHTHKKIEYAVYEFGYAMRRIENTGKFWWFQFVDFRRAQKNPGEDADLHYAYSKCLQVLVWKIGQCPFSHTYNTPIIHVPNSSAGHNEQNDIPSKFLTSIIRKLWPKIALGLGV